MNHLSSTATLAARRLLVSIAALILLAANPASARQPDFELERNATLETLHIIALLAPSWRPPDIGIRPLAEEAKAHFAPYASHPSVLLFDRMMREDKERVWINWLSHFTILALASSREAPNASYDPGRIGFHDFPYSEGARWSELMAAVNRFYRDANVEEFRRMSQPAYDCAFRFVRNDLPPPALLTAMEEYYRTSFSRYGVLPSPLSNIHVHMNVLVKTPHGKETYMVLAPNKMVETAPEYGCGYENGQDTNWLVIHEYGHSFVNPVLEPMQIRIERDSHLWAPVKDELEAQGMRDWFGAVIEHVNRLGEIRILEATGDVAGAQERRLNQVFERGMIYLPLLEDRIKEYEADRTKYPTFASFAERLIDAFSDLAEADEME